MILLTPRDMDKTNGTWGAVILLSEQDKQNVLFELNADGTEKITIVAQRGSLTATGAYKLSGAELQQSIINIVQTGVYRGPSKAAVTGIYRCKVSGNVIEVDRSALPLNKVADLDTLQKVVTLTRL